MHKQSDAQLTPESSFLFDSSGVLFSAWVLSVLPVASASFFSVSFTSFLSFESNTNAILNVINIKVSVEFVQIFFLTLSLLETVAVDFSGMRAKCL